MNISPLFFCLLPLVSMTSYAAPVYKVEVLIFEHTEKIAVDNERWRNLHGLLPTSQDGLPVEEGDEGIINELPSSSLNLVQARMKLEDSGNYRILYHKGWSQPVNFREENTATWVEIPGVLKGTINLHKQKYLHINTDFVFNSFTGAVRLKEDRRLKSKELHYFDHPLFGLLVRVVKF